MRSLSFLYAVPGLKIPVYGYFFLRFEVPRRCVIEDSQARYARRVSRRASELESAPWRREEDCYLVWQRKVQTVCKTYGVG